MEKQTTTSNRMTHITYTLFIEQMVCNIISLTMNHIPETTSRGVKKKDRPSTQ